MKQNTLIRQGRIAGFIKHLHPEKVSKHGLEFKNSLGLGGMALVLVCMLTLTGTLMLFAYQPSPQNAYDSILLLKNHYMFGNFVRNIHYYSANILVVITCLHMLRVFFTLGHIEVRRSNWIIGIFILLLVLLSCFTGYLLPWDQTAYWAITICINMFEYIPWGSSFLSIVADGHEVNAKTLQFFFTFHSTVIPIFLFSLLMIHFWKIRKAKGLVFSNLKRCNAPVGKLLVNSYPSLFIKEVSLALCLIATIMVVSLLFDAPLAQVANSGISPNPTKAPWYFAGLQELLLHIHPSYAVFVLPLLFFLLLCMAPFIAEADSNTGIWFISQRARKAAWCALLAATIIVPAGIVLSEYLLKSVTIAMKTPTSVLTGVIPTVIMTLILYGEYLLASKRFGLSHNEACQTIFVFLVTGYLILTITGTWFRGADMILGWGFV